MHTHGLLGEHRGMTFTTVHRIEPAPVPAFPSDVTIEAFRQAVRSRLELGQIDFVAVVTGVFLLSVGRLQREQQAGGEDSEELRHRNGLALGWRLGSCTLRCVKPALMCCVLLS
jgi:hypothetical protein